MKVIILTASTGGGHKRAAAALKEIIFEKDSSAEVLVVDALEEIGHIFNKTISDGYHYMATKTPKLYGKAYRSSDKDNALNDMINRINSQSGKRLLPLINEFAPDIIVTCHPFVAKMMGVLKGKGKITVPVLSIITDFSAHRTYIDSHIDAYVVSNDDMISELSDKYGVLKDKIYSLGIPVFSSFYFKDKKEDLIEELGFDKNIKTILIMAGSFGVTDVLKIYENLLDLKTQFQIIVITGKNKRLYSAFEKMLNDKIDEFEVEELSYFEKLPSDSKRRKAYELTGQIKGQIKESIDEMPIVKHFKRSTHAKKPTKLLYFIDNVQDYMHISDLIITKPGGLTVSESLASSLPLAIFNAFPGQEEDNADFVVRHNMAISLQKGKQGAQQIDELLTNEEKLSQMRENCRKLCKDKSSENIYNLMTKLIESNGISDLSDADKEKVN